MKLLTFMDTQLTELKVQILSEEDGLVLEIDLEVLEENKLIIVLYMSKKTLVLVFLKLQEFFSFQFFVLNSILGILLCYLYIELELR